MSGERLGVDSCFRGAMKCVTPKLSIAPQFLDCTREGAT